MALLPDYEDQVIKEGFLCPVCLEDFPGINDLQAHFTSGIHNENSEEQDTESVSRTDPPQTIGTIRSHGQDFRSVRRNRSEWYESQMEQLLEKLERVTAIEAPADEQKKLLEKQVVQWVNDSDVRLCPSCAKSFNLTRRRHHCRLCGAIMCNGCSQFLDYEEARGLVNNSQDSVMNKTVDAISSRQALSVFGAASNLKNSIRRGSTTSLLSVVNQNKDQTNVRMCFDCKVLIDRKRYLVEEQKSGHTITLFYSKLKERLEEAEKLVHIYYKICYSFSIGESVYDLEEAQALRVKLIRLSEEIDLISRKISTLGVTDPTPPPVTQIQLQSKIRMAATNFLKQYTLGLQSLPSQEEIDRIKRQKQEEQQKQEALKSPTRNKTSS